MSDDTAPWERQSQGTSTATDDTAPWENAAKAAPNARMAQREIKPPYVQGNIWDAGKNLQAAAANIMPAAMELPEGLINLETRVRQHAPEVIKPLLYSPIQRFYNEAFGRDMDVPIDASDKLAHAFNANDLARQAPIGGTVGKFVGPALLPGIGEIGPAFQAAPWIQGLVRGAVGGALYGGVGEAGRQAKLGDQFDPGLIAQGTAFGAAIGAPLGAAGGALRGLLDKLVQKRTPLPEPKNIHDDVLSWIDQNVPKRQPLPPAQQLAKKPLITPGPSERAHLNALDSQIPGSYVETPTPLQGHITTEAKSNLPPAQQQTGWRNARVAASSPAGPLDTVKLRKLALIKYQMDKAEARLQSAIRQVMEQMNVKPPTRKSLTPKQWQELHEVAQEVGLKPKYTDWFNEATMETPVQVEHAFKTGALRGRVQELKQLKAKRDALQKAYHAERSKADAPTERVSVPIGSRQSPRYVTVQQRRNVKPYTGTYSQMKAYDAKRSELMKDAVSEPRYTPPALKSAIEGDPELKAHLEQNGVLNFFYEFFNGESGGATPVDPVYMLQAFAQALKTAQQRLGAGFSQVNTKQLLARVLKRVRDAGYSSELTPRIFQRITLNELTSDIIRKSNPGFAYMRDAYLAKREQATLHGREATTEERLALQAMTPEQVLKSPVLKGWTLSERHKEAAAKKLDENYTEFLKMELKRLEELGVKQGLGGDPRYYRMLKWDLADMAGTPLNHEPGNFLFSRVGPFFSKAMTGQYTSIFAGNHPVGELHLGEAVLANATADPRSMLSGAITLSRSPVARKYAMALSGKGMQQKLMESDKFAIAKWVDHHINTPIKNAFEKTPVGNLAHKAITAELPERIKASMTAVTVAEGLARKYKYPGGAEQFMADYLHAAEGWQVAASRSTLFDKMLIESHIERNKRFMHMPEGPIQERTTFQRHDLTRPFFPFLRSIVQQARVWTSYMDDASEAVSKGDKAGFARSMGSVVAVPVLVSIWAGRYTLEEWQWHAIDAVNPEAGHKLRALFEQARKGNEMLGMGGRRSQHFGLKVFPAYHGGSVLLTDTASSEYRTAEAMSKGKVKPQDPRAVRAIAQALALGLVDNVAGIGTQRLATLYKDVREGVAGSEKYWVYPEKNLPKAVGDFLGHKQTRPLAAPTLRTNLEEKLGDFFVQGDRPNKIEIRDRVEEAANKKH